MKTQESIKIDFSNAIKQASNVDACVEDLRNVKSKLLEIISELSGGWKGEAATIYLEKCEALAEKIEKSATNLSRISGTISYTAKVYYDAEKAALAAINQKSV